MVCEGNCRHCSSLLGLWIRSSTCISVCITLHYYPSPHSLSTSHLFSQRIDLSILTPERTGSLNLFFCFRWILIAFKREFKFEDVIRLWEVLWTDFYSDQFVLFVAMAVLQSHRDVLIRYLTEFDEVLKYANDLSGTVSRLSYNLDPVPQSYFPYSSSFETNPRSILKRPWPRQKSSSSNSEEW